MKTVLDTNVVVSGLVMPSGICARVLRLVFAGAIPICVDERVIREYETVLPRPLFRLLPHDVADAMKVIRLRAEVVVPQPLSATLPDETDMPFLEVAAAANAVLVTGNRRHFPKRACAGVAVVSPREFLGLLRHSC